MKKRVFRVPNQMDESNLSVGVIWAYGDYIRINHYQINIVGSIYVMLFIQ